MEVEWHREREVEEKQAEKEATNRGKNRPAFWTCIGLLSRDILHTKNAYKGIVSRCVCKWESVRKGNVCTFACLPRLLSHRWHCGQSPDREIAIARPGWCRNPAPARCPWSFFMHATLSPPWSIRGINWEGNLAAAVVASAAGVAVPFTSCITSHQLKSGGFHCGGEQSNSLRCSAKMTDAREELRDKWLA